MSAIEHDEHEPILDCDCRACALVARDSFKEVIYQTRSTLFRLVHAQQWTRDSDSYVAALDEAKKVLSTDALRMDGE